MSEKSLIQKDLVDEQISKFGGKTSPKNTLNDLTGKEWVHFLCSVEVTSYSTKGKEGFSHKLRRMHPSPKPPILMKQIIEFFTKKQQWVLDPFVGVGGTLFGCSLSNRNGVGIEIEKKYIDTYGKVCEIEGVAKQTILQGNSRDIDEILFSMRKKNRKIPEKFDLILTDPPYANMMAKKRTATLKNGQKSTPFSGLKEDIGNLELKEFLEELKKIIEKSTNFLKEGGYLIMFIKDMQPKEHHNMLHADVVSKLIEIENLKFKGYKVWFDKTQTLYPLGYPYAFVANQFHQFILVFRKVK
jgi:DNA modification methylase